MDVIFHEFEPYYYSDTISPFGDSLDTGGMRREGDSSDGERRMVSVALVDSARVESEKEDSTRVESENEDSARVEPENEDSARVEPQREDSARVEQQREDSARIEQQREDSADEPQVEMNGPEDGRTQIQEERYHEVYVKRNKQSEEVVPTSTTCAKSLVPA